jgi:hypothetical protein
VLALMSYVVLEAKERQRHRAVLPLILENSIPKSIELSLKFQAR